MKAEYRNRRAKKGGKSFNPNHAQIEDAILEFQSRGGAINRIDANRENLQDFVNHREERAVDEFLNDPGFTVRY